MYILRIQILADHLSKLSSHSHSHDGLILLCLITSFKVCFLVYSLNDKMFEVVDDMFILRFLCVCIYYHKHASFWRGSDRAGACPWF